MAAKATPSSDGPRPDRRRRPTRRPPATGPMAVSTVVEQRRRQERAYQLRLAGLSLQEIADSPDSERGGAPLYASSGAATNAVKAAMARRTGSNTTDTMRWLAYERYERLIRSLWAKAIGGDTWSHDRVGSHLRDQAALMGTRAPIRQQVEVITESAIDAEIARLTAELSARGEAVDGEDLYTADDAGVAAAVNAAAAAELLGRLNGHHPG